MIETEEAKAYREMLERLLDDCHAGRQARDRAAADAVLAVIRSRQGGYASESSMLDGM